MYIKMNNTEDSPTEIVVEVRTRSGVGELYTFCLLGQSIDPQMIHRPFQALPQI